MGGTNNIEFLHDVTGEIAGSKAFENNYPRPLRIKSVYEALNITEEMLSDTSDENYGRKKSFDLR